MACKFQLPFLIIQKMYKYFNSRNTFLREYIDSLKNNSLLLMSTVAVLSTIVLGCIKYISWNRTRVDQTSKAKKAK